MKAPASMMMLLALAPALALGQVLVSDSWADGGRNNGADPLDTSWWTSTAANAIEVSPGSLGLVNSASANGNGIHTTFAPQSLNIGDSLTVTFTFTTPNTVATVDLPKYMALRVGLFDTLGRTGLAADQTASGASPNYLYNGLPGYWVDWDVNADTANITFRQHNTAATPGELLADGNAYPMISAGGSSVYVFAPNTVYTGLFSVTRTGANSMLLTGSLAGSTYFDTDISGIASTFDMVAFHLMPGAFGASTTPGTADNGIDFSNITIMGGAIPEPSSGAVLLGLTAFGWVCFRRRR